MKKYLSSLLVLTLFLHSFAVLAMKKRQEHQEETEIEEAIFQWKAGMNKRRLEKAVERGDIVCQWESQKNEGELPDGTSLCDDVIFYGIVPFADSRTLLHIRLVNKRYKDKLDTLVVFVCLSNFKKGRIRQELAWNVLDFVKIREFINNLKEKIKKRGRLRVYYRGDKKLETGILSKESFQPALFEKLQYRVPVVLRTHAADIRSLIDAVLFVGGYFLLRSIFKKIGLKRSVRIRVSDNNIPKKIFAMVVNTVGFFGIKFLAGFLSNRIVRNFHVNFGTRQLLAMGMFFGIEGAIEGAICGKIKGASCGLVVGLLFGGCMAVDDFFISPFCQDFVVNLRGRVSDRYEQDKQRLKEVLEFSAKQEQEE